MDVRIARSRLTIPTVVAALAAACAIAALSYRNGYPLSASAFAGVATALVALWTIAVEP